jgi:hypothetical protein
VDYARSVVVRCTRKLLDLLGKGVVAPTAPSATDEDWYANLLWIDRRKCLLLTHADTLFPVFRAAIRVDELRPLGPYAVRAVEEELSACCAVTSSPSSATMLSPSSKRARS